MDKPEWLVYDADLSKHVKDKGQLLQHIKILGDVRENVPSCAIGKLAAENAISTIISEKESQEWAFLQVKGGVHKQCIQDVAAKLRTLTRH
eukprot:627575-Pyramimonas_sp.AAC.1